MSENIRLLFINISHFLLFQIGTVEFRRSVTDFRIQLDFWSTDNQFERGSDAVDLRNMQLHTGRSISYYFAQYKTDI